MITVLIADDNAHIRRAVQASLQGLAEVAVVGEAMDGQAAVQLTQSLQPTVVLMDIHMPKLNGIEATRLIRSLAPDTIVVGMSADITPETEQGIRSAGASVLVLKEFLPQRLTAVITQALKRQGEGHHTAVPRAGPRPAAESPGPAGHPRPVPCGSSLVSSMQSVPMSST